MNSAVCKESDAPADKLSQRTNGTPAYGSPRENDYAAVNNAQKENDIKTEGGSPQEMRSTLLGQDQVWGTFSWRDALNGMAARFVNGRKPPRTTLGSPGPASGMVGRIGLRRGF